MAGLSIHRQSRQLKLTKRARLLEEDPAARAGRYWEEQAAACGAESACRSEIMRLHREARLRAMLASVQGEQQAEMCPIQRVLPFPTALRHSPPLLRR